MLRVCELISEMTEQSRVSLQPSPALALSFQTPPAPRTSHMARACSAPGLAQSGPEALMSPSLRFSPATPGLSSLVLPASARQGLSQPVFRDTTLCTKRPAECPVDRDLQPRLGEKTQRKRAE